MKKLFPKQIKANLNINMALFRVNMLLEDTEKENIPMKMVPFTKVNLMIIKSKDLEVIPGQMEENIKENG